MNENNSLLKEIEKGNFDVLDEEIIKYLQTNKSFLLQAIDDKDPRLQQIDNYFKQQLEQNMVNSPKIIH